MGPQTGERSRAPAHPHPHHHSPLPRSYTLPLQYGCPAPPPGSTVKDSLILAGGLEDCEVRSQGGIQMWPAATAMRLTSWALLACVGRRRRLACTLCVMHTPFFSGSCLEAALHACAPLMHACCATAYARSRRPNPPPARLALTPLLLHHHQGILTPYGQEFVLSTSVITDASGNFSSDSSLPASVAFPPNVCLDNLVGSAAKYWNFVPTAPGKVVKATPVSNLAEALRRYRCNVGGVATCRPVGDPLLIQDAYTLFGFPITTSADYASWDGIVVGSKFGVPVYEFNQRVATVLTTASTAASAACGGFDASHNAYVQTAVAYAMVEVLAPLPTAGERRMALIDGTVIAPIIKRALHNVQTPEAGPLTCQDLSTSQGDEIIAEISNVSMQGRDPMRDFRCAGATHAGGGGDAAGSCASGHQGHQAGFQRRQAVSRSHSVFLAPIASPAWLLSPFLVP
jgi:hypothetical protein